MYRLSYSIISVVLYFLNKKALLNTLLNVYLTLSQSKTSAIRKCFMKYKSCVSFDRRVDVRVRHLFVTLQGKFYLLIEELSQLFRALVPIQLWYKYIMGEDPSNSYFLGAMLIIIYSLCKVVYLIQSIKNTQQC